MRTSAPTSTEPGARRFVGVVAGVAGVCAAVVIGWLLARESERLAARPPVDEALVIVPVVDGLADESSELEAMFDDAVIESAVPTEEQLGWLEESVAAQRELVRLAAAGDGPEVERLIGLDAKLARARVQFFSGPIDLHERLADDLLKIGDTAGAIEALRDAAKVLDLAVGRGAPLDSRRAGLERRMESILAASLGAEVDRLERDARQAWLEGRRADADGLLAEAALVQRRLNFEFARAAQASLERLELLERTRAEWAGAPRVPGAP